MKRAILFIMLIHGLAFAQQPELDKHIHTGNEFYRQKEFEKAASEYESALGIDPQNAIAQYNLAAVRARQSKTADAAKLYNKIVTTSSDLAIKAKSQFNEGALLSQEKKLVESIEAYKKALRLDPGDKEARENLQKALMELKKKNPPPKKDDKKKKQEQQKQQKQPQSKMSQKEAEQRLELLEQKEKEIQLRQQKAKSSSGGSQTKDW